MNRDGSLDKTFNKGAGASGGASGGAISSVAVEPDNKIVLVGAFNSFNGVPSRGIARLNPDGSLDENFDPELEFPSSVGAMTVQVDGKSVVAAAGGLVNGIPRSSIARLNRDGSLDEGFTAGNSLDTVPSFVVSQPDGKVLIGRPQTDSQGFLGQEIARLNAGGTMDDGFSPSTNTFLTISALIRQPNGKVIVAGKFKNVFESGIIRLNEDGTMDSNFIRGEGTAGTVSSVALQSDEKILIAGAFFSFNGVGKINLVRLKTDGTMDFGFTATRMTNISQTLRSISVEPDGKILLVVTEAGFYDHLVRLNEDGSTDNSFTSPLGSVNALTIGGDGRIYALGVDKESAGNHFQKLYRLNPDGSVDSRFVPVEVGLVHSLALEPDGLSLLLAGDFLRVNGVPRTSLARVFTVPQPRLTAADYSGGSFRLLLTGETNRMYRIDASTTLLDWLALGTVSLSNSPQPFVDSNGTSFTRRFYRAVAIH